MALQVYPAVQLTPPEAFPVLSVPSNTSTSVIPTLTGQSNTDTAIPNSYLTPGTLASTSSTPIIEIKPTPQVTAKPDPEEEVFWRLYEGLVELKQKFEHLSSVRQSLDKELADVPASELEWRIDSANSVITREGMRSTTPFDMDRAKSKYPDVVGYTSEYKEMMRRGETECMSPKKSQKQKSRKQKGYNTRYDFNHRVADEKDFVSRDEDIDYRTGLASKEIRLGLLFTMSFEMSWVRWLPFVFILN